MEIKSIHHDNIYLFKKQIKSWLKFPGKLRILWGRENIFLSLIKGKIQ